MGATRITPVRAAKRWPGGRDAQPMSGDDCPATGF